MIKRKHIVTVQLNDVEIEEALDTGFSLWRALTRPTGLLNGLDDIPGHIHTALAYKALRRYVDDGDMHNYHIHATPVKNGSCARTKEALDWRIIVLCRTHNLPFVELVGWAYNRDLPAMPAKPSDLNPMASLPHGTA